MVSVLMYEMSLSQQADNHITGAVEKFKPDIVKVQPKVLFVSTGIICLLYQDGCKFVLFMTAH